MTVTTQVGAAMETNEINVPECFNIVNQLSRSILSTL